MHLFGVLMMVTSRNEKGRKRKKTSDQGLYGPRQRAMQAVRPDAQIICSTLGHLHECKFAQVSRFQILPNTKLNLKIILKLVKSGHTEKYKRTGLLKLLFFIVVSRLVGRQVGRVGTTLNAQQSVKKKVQRQERLSRLPFDVCVFKRNIFQKTYSSLNLEMIFFAFNYYYKFSNFQGQLFALLFNISTCLARYHV